jgi:phosphotransferase system  glucose/maltose/N-acetylglucosamine-specific IIC component
VMMFGLPAAALAMWHEARPERRKVIGGIMAAAAITSLVTGVTEPIEFSFLFVAPALFAVHAVLTGVSMSIAALLNIKIGFGFSAGLIDYLLNFGKANTHNPLLILPIGAVYAVVYYTLFRFLIRRFNLMTPGREPEDQPQENSGSVLDTEPDARSDRSAAVASSATTGQIGESPPA